MGFFRSSGEFPGPGVPKPLGEKMEVNLGE